MLHHDHPPGGADRRLCISANRIAEYGRASRKIIDELRFNSHTIVLRAVLSDLQPRIVFLAAAVFGRGKEW